MAQLGQVIHKTSFYSEYFSNELCRPLVSNVNLLTSVHAPQIDRHLANVAQFNQLIRPANLSSKTTPIKYPQEDTFLHVGSTNVYLDQHHKATWGSRDIKPMYKRGC